MSLSVSLTACAIALAMLLIRPRTFLNHTLFSPIHAYGSFSVCRTALTYLSPVALNRVQRRTMLTNVFDPKQPACLADLISSSVQTLVSVSSPPESNSTPMAESWLFCQMSSFPHFVFLNQLFYGDHQVEAGYVRCFTHMQLLSSMKKKTNCCKLQVSSLRQSAFATLRWPHCVFPPTLRRLAATRLRHAITPLPAH